MAAIPRLNKETPLYSRVKNVGAYLKVLADAITSLVQMDETYIDPSGHTIVNHAASMIRQNATNIEARVEKDGVISSINQSAESIKIAAGRVDIEGAAIFKSGGKLAKVVTSSQTQWYSSTSSSQLSGGSWATTQPNITAGRYLWERTLYNYSDGTQAYLPSEGGVCVTSPTDISDVTSKANASVKRSTQLWYTKADTVAPAKPTSKVTSASTAGNGWRVIVPAYSATYPNYYYCWQHEHMDGSFEWSDVVFDRAATENFGQVRGAQARSQLVYRSAAAGTNSLATITTWVTQTGDVQGTWTTKRPTYDSAWPVLFTANQSQTVAQMAAGTACSCTTPLKDDTTTVIDGGHITTGTIDASKVTVSNIDASKINTGTLDAKCIGTGSIAIGKLDSVAQFRLNRDVSYRGVCSSSESNSTKIAICNCFTLATGVAITVYNSTAQTYVGALKLGVMGSGDSLYTAYSVYVGGVATSSSNQLLWAAGSSITFVFTGGHWEVADSPGTWEGGTCNVASGTAGKTASVGQCVLFKGASVKVRMSYDNTASSPTLNVQSLGAKNVYFGSASNRPTRDNGYSWKGGSLVEFVFDGQYWRTGSRTYINGGDIVTGTIDASKVTVTNLDASKITSGTIDAARINVSAIKADIIDAIEITGEQIKGGTITGVVLETESSRSGTKISISEGTTLFYPITSSSYTKVPFAISAGGSGSISGSYIYPLITMGYRSVDSSGFYIDQRKPLIQFFDTRDLYLFSGRYGGMRSTFTLHPDGVGIGVDDSTSSWIYHVNIEDTGIKFYRGSTLIQSWT